MTSLAFASRTIKEALLALYFGNVASPQVDDRLINQVTSAPNFQIKNVDKVVVSFMKYLPALARIIIAVPHSEGKSFPRENGGIPILRHGKIRCDKSFCARSGLRKSCISNIKIAKFSIAVVSRVIFTPNGNRTSHASAIILEGEGNLDNSVSNSIHFHAIWKQIRPFVVLSHVARNPVAFPARFSGFESGDPSVPNQIDTNATHGDTYYRHGPHNGSPERRCLLAILIKFGTLVCIGDLLNLSRAFHIVGRDDAFSGYLIFGVGCIDCGIAARIAAIHQLLDAYQGQETDYNDASDENPVACIRLTLAVPIAVRHRPKITAASLPRLILFLIMDPESISR